MNDPAAEVVARFDFRRVRAAMRAAGRRWADCDTEDGQPLWYTPTVPQLRRVARKLLEQLADCRGEVSSGGLTAYRAGRVLGLRYDLETSEVEILVDS